MCTHSLDLRPAYPLMLVGNLSRCNSCDGSQLTAAIIRRNKFLDPEGYIDFPPLESLLHMILEEWDELLQAIHMDGS